MSFRIALLRLLYASPRFRGRDRLIGMIADTFVAGPSRLVDGTLMHLDPAEWSQLEIVMHGATEPATLKLIHQLVGKGDCVIDVGAHVGHHTICAAQAAGPDGDVYAFDPQPYNADRISRNALLNGLANVVTVCAAAGNTDGFVRLPIQSERDRSRLSLHEASPGDQAAFVEVSLRRLDTYMAANGVQPPKLVKIDVEGYELEVLEGLGDRLGACSNIILEMLAATGAVRNQQVAEFLRQAGFQLRDITGKPWQHGQPLPESNIWAARV